MLGKVFLTKASPTPAQGGVLLVWGMGVGKRTEGLGRKA